MSITDAKQAIVAALKKSPNGLKLYAYELPAHLPGFSADDVNDAVDELALERVVRVRPYASPPANNTAGPSPEHFDYDFRFVQLRVAYPPSEHY